MIDFRILENFCNISFIISTFSSIFLSDSKNFENSSSILSPLNSSCLKFLIKSNISLYLAK